MYEKRERCNTCGTTRFISSTEWENNRWVWKKVCKNCGGVVETRVLKK